MNVPLFKPSLGEDELQAVAEVFESHWLALGPRVAEFERRFAETIGTRHAIAVNSGTAALHLAMRAAGVEGGEVLVPALTFITTAFAAEYNGARPVFVDVDEVTLTMDPDDLRRKITERTRAIVPVHLGGQACRMCQIKELAEGLPVIEDVANACGGEYQGHKLGGIGNFGCFSFEVKKNMTTGDGGMITTNDGEAAERLRAMRSCGMSRDTWRREQGGYSWYYEVRELGFKANMNDITAAIGLVQLGKLEARNARVRQVIKAYLGALAGFPWLRLPFHLDLDSGGHWLFVVRVEERAAFIEHLAEHGIGAGVHFMPLHLHPYYWGSGADVPVAERVGAEIVSLPLYPTMTEKEFLAVVEAVRSFRCT